MAGAGLNSPFRGSRIKAMTTLSGRVPEAYRARIIELTKDINPIVAAVAWIQGTLLGTVATVVAVIAVVLFAFGLDAARKLQFPLPLAAAAHQLYIGTAAAAHGAEDDSAVIKLYAALNGITLPTKKDAA